MAHPVTRQHETTRIAEVEGMVCRELLAVYDRTTGGIGPLYLHVDGGWHRFYVDAGLLFWQEGEEPDAEDDLLDDDEYRSLGAELVVEGAKLRRVEMRDCELVLEFENQARLRLFADVRSQYAVIRELVAGT